MAAPSQQEVTDLMRDYVAKEPAEGAGPWAGSGCNTVTVDQCQKSEFPFLAIEGDPAGILGDWPRGGLSGWENADR